MSSLGSRPLTGAAAQLRPGAVPVEISPGAFLADLIDLRGGVLLAERLERLDADGEETDAIPADWLDGPEHIRSHTLEELSDLEARLVDAFDCAFKPRYQLPTAQRVHMLMRHAGALGTRARRPHDKVARQLWAVVGGFFDVQYRRARLGARDLRLTLTGPLQRLGPDAARLERLDATLSMATAASTAGLFRRLLAECETRFRAGLRALVRALPTTPGPDDLAPGLRPDGWLGQQVGLGRRAVFAVFEHEKVRLESLVDAACACADDPKSEGADP